MRPRSADDPPFLRSCGERHLRLYDLWASKCTGRAMPTRSDFGFEDFLPWMGRLVIYDALRVGQIAQVDFVYRLFGSLLAHDVGIDLTGKHVLEASLIKDPLFALETLHQVIDSKKPVYRNDLEPCLDGRSYTPERIFLPLSENGFDVDVIIMFASEFRDANGKTIPPTSSSLI